MDNLAYQDGIHEEIIDGKIVFMSPRPAVNHNIVAGNIFRIFSGYLAARSGEGCIPFGDGTDLYLTEKNHFIPDGMIVCSKDKIKPDGIYGAPDLVIEVLSPSTAKNDRGHKKDAYAAAGVREYWIVEHSVKAIEVYLLKDGQYIIDEVYTVYPDYLLNKMSAEERKATMTEFKCSLYDDLLISIFDVFRWVFD